MTLDVYGSLFEEDLEALADRLEERFAGQCRDRQRCHVSQSATSPARNDQPVTVEDL